MGGKHEGGKGEGWGGVGGSTGEREGIRRGGVWAKVT